MEHAFYSDGDKRKISWIIESETGKMDQVRTHIDDYFEKISAEQSKYVALHVGIFWGIGTFIIKNGDTVKIKIDHKPMFENMVENKLQNDPFISHRTKFIRLLIDQRNLKADYQMIEPEQNKATALLS